MMTQIARASARENRHGVVQVMHCWYVGRFPGKKDLNVPAKLLNQSTDGLCLGVDQTIEPGSLISVKMVTPGIETRDTYKLHRGQVKWCRQLDTAASPRYSVGIKIHESVVQTIMNLSHPDFS